ncbi:MAG: S24/S26 family peptidase [Planctomycetes bacterium]|nr:S24/S26 family peptidase [Planctomycetota bacterium]
MATATTKPAEVRALSRERLAKRLRRITLVVGVSLGIWAYLCWGARWVPIGMDTVPAIPPGSFCVVDKRASTVKIGSHVFIELPGVGVVLSRVTARNGDRIRIEHPNVDSSYPDSRTLGEVPVSAVTGTVLGAFSSAAGTASGR